MPQKSDIRIEGIWEESETIRIQSIVFLLWIEFGFTFENKMSCKHITRIPSYKNNYLTSSTHEVLLWNTRMKMDKDKRIKFCDNLDWINTCILKENI